MKSALAFPLAYDIAQFVIRGPQFNSLFASRFIRPSPGSRILDIGCGTATIFESLPGVQYVGFDMSNAYVRACRKRYGSKGKFYCKTVSEESLDDLGDFDAVLAIGVIHHLDDAEASSLFRIAHAALRTGGRLITLDGVFVDDQTRLEKWLLENDRGRFVRREADYLALAQSCFPCVTATISHSLFRIPYTNVVLECCK